MQERFDDIVEGKTVKEEVDRGSGIRRMVVMEHKGDLHPQVVIEDTKGNPLGLYPVPEKAHIMVTEGQKLRAGTLIAKTPREITGTQDIVGGLPRVTELFEARKPKEPAVLSEIDGVVEIGEKEVVIQDNDFNRSTLEVDDIVTCHTKPNLGLYNQLKEAGLNVFNVGDSVAPRTLNQAVKEGANFALTLEDQLVINPNHAIVNNLPIGEFYFVAVDMDEPYTIYGGTQDNNSQGGPSRTMTNAGIRNSDWFVTLFGDGHQSAVDPNNPDITELQSQVRAARTDGG